MGHILTAYFQRVFDGLLRGLQLALVGPVEASVWQNVGDAERSGENRGSFGPAGGLLAQVRRGPSGGQDRTDYLKPHFSDKMIDLDDSITPKRLWHSTVVLPGFESHGPVHPSPDDVCPSRVDRSDIEETLGTRPLRPVCFQQKRDARNAALRQACDLFMEHVRSNAVIMHAPQN